jgi:hypothetical protein
MDPGLGGSLKMSLRGTRGWLAAVCVGAAIVAAACGGDDASTAAKAQRKILAPNEEPDAFARRMTKLLETARDKKDCQQIYEINSRSATPFACPAPAAFRKSMASFEVVGAEIYGTGGIVDYKSGKTPDGAAIVLYAAKDRRWGVGHLGLLTKPSVGTDDETSRAAYRTTVERYLQAVRKRDCDAFLEVAATKTSDKAKNCKLPFESTKPLAKRLERNPQAKLKYEGGNGTYGFFSIETAKPTLENSTIGVFKLVKAGRPTYAVLDVAPAPTSADLQSLRDDIELQKELKKQSPTTPSKQPLKP